jgi:hypothetical protein
MRSALASCAFFCLVFSGCDCGGGQLITTGRGGGGGTHGTGGGSQGTGGGSGATGGGTGGSMDAGGPNCGGLAADQMGCPCNPNQTRACYSDAFSPTTRNVGQCHDGTQTCGTGEFAGYGPCTGDVTPVQENCTDGLDNDCNALTDCSDPACATAAACNAACQPGATRPCYTGAAGTENVGQCHDGTQTCLAGGVWSTSCDGQVTPTAEACCDSLDHNCNGLPGCLDFLSCFSASCCQTQCNAMAAGPGCVCPMGSGDTATCPRGMFGKSGGGIPGWVACCPCTASDCSNAGCCAETVCAGNSQCNGLTCRSALPASCNGLVNMDCDDFPEDCDEPCCMCSMCSCTATGDACTTDGDCCSGSCGGTTCN